MTYHGRNFTALTKCNFTWTTQDARMLLEDIVDINAGGKTLMMMWNEHMQS